MSSEPSTITVRDPSDLPSHGGGLASVILADETVGVEHASVGIVTIDSGTRGSRHVREVEEIVVLEGAGCIVADDETVTLTGGQAAIVPPGVHHYHENADDAAAEALDLRSARTGTSHPRPQQRG